MLYSVPFAAKPVSPSQSRSGAPAPREDRALDIHLIAIGGTGMAPLACLLKAQGHRVRGSDEPLYPPMSTLLDESGIVPRVGFKPEHLEPRPDLVVIGNAVPRDNPEAAATEHLGIPRLSMPEALARFFLQHRRPLVVAGTHGKTTTTAIAAWVYAFCGTDPGYFVGGIPENFKRSFHEGRGERFIIEGDEYNAAYFDRGPKFLHYRPESLVLTSVEYDHADLYPDPAALIDAYERLVVLVPEDGLVAACGDMSDVRRVAERATCPVVFYGLDKGNDVRPAGPIRSVAGGCRFCIADREVGEIEVEIPLAGEHNVANTLAAWSVARRDGLPAELVAAGLREFRGVRRRMEKIGESKGIMIIDDFAHHPTAVATTLRALRQRYPDRRLVAVYEPRTLTAGRHLFFGTYRQAFRVADRVFLAPIFHAGRLDPDKRLDLAALVTQLGADGVAASTSPDLEALLASLISEVRAGDVVATMSSGEFGRLPQRLLEALEGGDAERD